MPNAIDRRAVLGGAAALALSTQLVARPRRRPLGIQLYTLMAALDADFDGTIGKVAAMGYREVETLGSFGRDPAEVRAILDKHGLVSPSQHIMPPGLYKVFDDGVAKRIDMPTFERKFIEAFSFDRVEGLIEACVAQARPLGQKYIVWQISWPSQLRTRAQIDQLIKALNRAADAAHAAGFTLAYHNHSQEFTKVGSDVPYDLILQGTDPAKLKFEMDLAWAVNARVDPVAYFRRFPGRFRMLHMKDIARDGSVRDPGEGIVPFKTIIPAAEAAGVEHFYVEYDVPTDPLATLGAARRYLAPLM
ncbi:sugar phosphate isomerase/epimerase [Sphingomonas sp. BK580]|uniref:sugar phosphate isomerase/epimerase family protein n=1 Tax=Sphingomonas sp. BK580 TaxID=2586972 RepID=UPI00161CC972|nr:sugar phosphate isomerase/epimerase [Sphingomonas sp. BK580]MBB3694486.1 sugar phosphate isomerase/epimerase [Sphingomonas sp. BK580]